ncbi:hypothetical protein B1B00_08635 [Bacillus sp. DSM 27956]|nr:hypothetical protein B1B00_08635 [Bacillus sp. DSM 27956]
MKKIGIGLIATGLALSVVTPMASAKSATNKHEEVVVKNQFDQNKKTFNVLNNSKKKYSNSKYEVQLNNKNNLVFFGNEDIPKEVLEENAQVIDQIFSETSKNKVTDKNKSSSVITYAYENPGDGTSIKNDWDYFSKSQITSTFITATLTGTIVALVQPSIFKSSPVKNSAAGVLGGGVLSVATINSKRPVDTNTKLIRWYSSYYGQYIYQEVSAVYDAYDGELLDVVNGPYQERIYNSSLYGNYGGYVYDAL